MDNSYLELESEEASDLDPVLGCSVTYRIAVGPQQGRKAFTLQTIEPREDDGAMTERVAQASGFSLHAGVAAAAHERGKLEKLCRYITRPPIVEKRLSLTSNGWVRYQLKTPYRDGTTHVVLEPLDFIARLAALIPRPRVNLTRYHGVFAPNSALRAEITPGKRGRRRGEGSDEQAQTAVCARSAMSWAQRLKRVFKIDIETCEDCGGAVRVIASIEDPAVINRILARQPPTEYQTSDRAQDWTTSSTLVSSPMGRTPPVAFALQRRGVGHKIGHA